MADHRRLPDLGVRHQLVLQLDRRDPLAARLDEVLGAVDEADPPSLVHRGDVAGAQPSVVGEALARPRVVVVRRRDPRPAALQLARSTRRRDGDRRRCPARRPGTRRRTRAPHAGAQVGLLASGEVAAGRRRGAHRGHRARLRHPPRLQDAAGRAARGTPPTAPWAPPSRRTGWPAGATCRGPRGGAAPASRSSVRRPRRVTRSSTIRSAIAGPDRSGPGITRSAPVATAGVGEPPRVGVEHRHHRQDAVGLAHPERVGHHRPHRVQERAAVAVDDALGVAGGAARVAHARRLVLVVDGGTRPATPRRAAPRSRAACVRPASASGTSPRAVVHHDEVAQPLERRQQRRQQRRAASGRRRSPRRRRG